MASEIEQPVYYGRPVMKPTTGAYVRHLLLLGVTFCTATIAGTLFPFGSIDVFPTDDPQNFSDILQLLATLPVRYAGMIIYVFGQIAEHTEKLVHGLQFSISLLFIL